MSDDHKVDEIGRWYDAPIFRNRMEKYMTKWLLTNKYDVIKLSEYDEHDEHIYFNYACNKHYINIEEKHLSIGRFYVEIAPNGREFLNKGE
jgi:hypothetical protein